MILPRPCSSHELSPRSEVLQDAVRSRLKQCLAGAFTWSTIFSAEATPWGWPSPPWCSLPHGAGPGLKQRSVSVWAKPLASPLRAGMSAQYRHGCCQGSGWLLNMRPDLKASEGFKLCLLKMTMLCSSVCISVHAICLLRQERRPGWRGRGLEDCFDRRQASE